MRVGVLRGTGLFVCPSIGPGITFVALWSGWQPSRLERPPKEEEEEEVREKCTPT